MISFRGRRFINKKSLKGLIILGIVKGLVTLAVLMFFGIFSGLEVTAKTDQPVESEGNMLEKT